jgi:hypothetical protein
MMLSPAELSRLEVITAALPPSDAALLRRLVEAIEPRQCRITRRDEAIRAALAEHFPGKPTPAAGALWAALRSYAATGWKTEQDFEVSPSSDPRRRALHRILRLSGGKVLCQKQLANIIGNLCG